ncbi:MAG: heme biosynthesis HemY N-terminal domain-containing protein [Bauldia sp.]
MIRVLGYVVLVFALAAGFAWLAERPGGLSISWQGYEVNTSLMTAAVALAVVVGAMALLGALIRAILRAPHTVADFVGARRRDRGYRALSRGIVAVGAGDVRAARRAAQESQSLLGREPLVLLLAAQAAQIAGDGGGARAAFEALSERPDTRVLGLHGLFIEARRQGEHAAARHFAEEATRMAPKTAWAGTALFEYQSQAGDWQGALATLTVNADAKIVEQRAARRLRAVLLTARALELEAGQPDEARSAALEAQRLAPELVPAAVAAARLLARVGEIRHATRLLEATWKASPHPEIAEAYAAVRPGDSVRDRLKRVRRLAELRANHPEGAMAVARAAIDGRDWQAARDALGGLMRAEPSERVCLLMAEIEEGEHGDQGRVRAWLKRGLAARRDPVWTADGHVFDAWAPVSPISGRVDAFEWRVVAEQLPPPRGLDATADGTATEAVEKMATETGLAARIGRETRPPPAAAGEAASTPPGGPQPAGAQTAPTAGTKVMQPLPDDPGPEAALENDGRRFSAL